MRDVLSEHGSAIDVMMRYVLSSRSTNGMLLPSLLSPNFLICTSVSDEIRNKGERYRLYAIIPFSLLLSACFVNTISLCSSFLSIQGSYTSCSFTVARFGISGAFIPLILPLWHFSAIFGVFMPLFLPLWLFSAISGVLMPLFLHASASNNSTPPILQDYYRSLPPVAQFSRFYGIFTVHLPHFKQKRVKCLHLI